MKNRATNGQEGTHHTLFYAQSWILVHYLLNKNKMSELGKYFGLVEIQRVPVEQAIQQAFGMSVAQLDQEVKTYFHSLAPLFTALDESQRPTLRRFRKPLIKPRCPFLLMTSVRARSLLPFQKRKRWWMKWSFVFQSAVSRHSINYRS